MKCCGKKYPSPDIIDETAYFVCPECSNVLEIEGYQSFSDEEKMVLFENESRVNLFDKFIDDTYLLFKLFEKPKYSTDIHHCEECREHNNEIANINRRELSLKQIGDECWGISSFLTPEAMAYYLPRFIELAVSFQKENGSPYMCLFLNQIGLHSDSEQFSLLSIKQRQAVRDSLIILKTKYLHVLAEHCWDDEIDNAICQWNT